MTQRVTFPAATGEASGVLFTPDGGGRHPAVVLIHEWWGVNEQIQSLGQKWASEGFVAIVPDLFHGAVTKDAKEAEAMMGKLDFPRALTEIAGAAAFLKDHPRSTGKVSVTGYCMGGALSFAAATMVPGLAAVVPFYGVPPGADWSKVDAPVQAHFATIDDWATVDKAKEIQGALAKRGRSMELHVYEAQHAFCNDKRPEVYSPEAAALAWQRTVQFIRDHSV
jgi:carboxymethylenebutenolidase